MTSQSDRRGVMRYLLLPMILAAAAALIPVQAQSPNEVKVGRSEEHTSELQSH